MQKIVPHLWFDTQAREAADFYTRCFPDSVITDISKLEGTPSGTVEMLSMELSGFQVRAISAGPYFKFTPAVSFLVACRTAQEVNRLWDIFKDKAKILMPLESYPFSSRYVWLEDRYGLSWQLMDMGNRTVDQPIVPTLMFTGDLCGKAEEAISYYRSVFHQSTLGEIMRYEGDTVPDKAGTIKHASFSLENVEFAAMDSAYDHQFTFNEAISMMVYCSTQEDIDYYWGALSAQPEAEQCGWLKDRYGVSWQIVPTVMDELMRTQDKDKLRRVTEAFLKMKKFDIAELVRAGS